MDGKDDLQAQDLLVTYSLVNKPHFRILISIPMLAQRQKRRFRRLQRHSNVQVPHELDCALIDSSSIPVMHSFC